MYVFVWTLQLSEPYDKVSTALENCYYCHHTVEDSFGVVWQMMQSMQCATIDSVTCPEGSYYIWHSEGVCVCLLHMYFGYPPHFPAYSSSLVSVQLVSAMAPSQSSC